MKSKIVIPMAVCALLISAVAIYAGEGQSYLVNFTQSHASSSCSVDPQSGICVGGSCTFTETDNYGCQGTAQSACTPNTQTNSVPGNCAGTVLASGATACGCY